MATQHEIQCVTLSERNNIHERILYIGGLNENGIPWKLTHQEAIRGVEAGYWKFYVLLNDEKLDVLVAWSVTGDKYLKTEADIPGMYFLLYLPDCP